MRPRWIILGLFLAGIVYGTIIWWPERPMWKTKLTRFSRVLGFSDDCRCLFVLHDKRKDYDAPIVAHFSRWDTLTGKLLSETPISIPDRLEHVLYELSSDGKLLTASGIIDLENGTRGCVLYVVDTASGQKRLGPIHCGDDHRGRTYLSHDGRRIVYYFLDEKDLTRVGGIDIIDCNTGNRILRAANPAQIETIRSACISPDGSLIALLLWNFGRAPNYEDFSIRILELPSGREHLRFQLAKRKWQRLDWKNHDLTAFAHVRDPNTHERLEKAFTFDLESIPAGQEIERPELEKRDNLGENGKLVTNWQECKSGNGWKAEIQWGGDIEFDWLWKYWNKCAEWLGANKVDELATRTRLRFIEVNSNRCRYQSPPFVDDLEPCVAESGTVYAVLTRQGELSVWNANPFPRWPWALAASLGTLLLILLLGRWRTKRLARS